PMRTIAAEQLVGTVTGYGHLHVARHRFREEIRRDDARERLVEGTKNPADRRGIVGAGDRLFAMIRVVAFRDPSGPLAILFLALRGRLILVRQRERLDPIA